MMRVMPWEEPMRVRNVEALQPQRAQAAPRQVIAGGGAHTADADDDRVVDPW